MSTQPDNSASREQQLHSINEAKERFRAQQRKAAATPPPSEWKKQFGDKCNLSNDGQTFELTVREDHDVRIAHEMQEGARKIEVEEGYKQQAMMKRERVIRRDGRMVEFPEELVDRVKHRFKGGAGRNGMAVPLRFSMSGIHDIPKWSRICSVCGTPQGLWRQWTKPVCDDDFTCDDCGAEGDWFWESDEEE